MIGRATIGNPWFIKDVIDFLNDLDTCSCTKIGTKNKCKLITKERLNIILRHLHLLIEEKRRKELL